MLTDKAIHKDDMENRYWITADLRGQSLFSHLDSNYDIEDILRKHKVLRKNQYTDSEYCQFWAYFSTKKVAENFIKRYNEFIKKFTI
tara:strand:- start:1752 stop:2012 length:261 start_codon:yes stop_codon:yes gene_type:complete